MLNNAEIILMNDISEGESILNSLPVQGEGLSSLRQSEVFLGGMDLRRAPQEWGEGVSPTHLLCFIVAGHLQYIGGSTPIEVNRGQLLIVPSHMPKRLLLQSGTVKIVWFHLHLKEIWSHLNDIHELVRNVQNMAILDTSMEQLLKECRIDDLSSVESRHLLSQLIAHYLMREVAPAETSRYNATRRILDGIWGSVNARPAHLWTVTELARLAQMSCGHFHRTVRSLGYESPIEVVREIRLQQAVGLLRNTDWSLERIANAVGYQSVYAFSNAFLRQYGVRPGAFRRL